MKAIFTQTTNIQMLLITNLTTISSTLPCYYFAVICSWFRCHECVYDEQCPPDQFCLNRYNPFQDNECATNLHNGLWCNRDAMCKSGKFVTDSLSCSCLFICKRIQFHFQNTKLQHNTGISPSDLHDLLKSFSTKYKNSYDVHFSIFAQFYP